MKKRIKRYIKIDSQASLEKLKEYRKIRWEFLRLNPHYRIDYDTYEKNKKEVCCRKKRSKITKRIMDERIKFIKKWLILPQDYNNNTPPVSIDPFYEPITFLSDSKPDTMTKRVISLKKMKIKGVVDATSALPTLIKVAINPLFPRDFILGLLKSMLDVATNVKTAILDMAEYSTAKNRMRFPDYKYLLKLYRLKNKNQRVKYKRLAADIFHTSIDEVKESDEKKVEKWYKKSEKMVTQGIKAFPPIKLPPR